MNNLEEQGVVLGARKARFPIMVTCPACGHDSFTDVLVITTGVYVDCPHCNKRLVFSVLTSTQLEKHISRLQIARKLQSYLKDFLAEDMR